jgi:hypothetical protein
MRLFEISHDYRTVLNRVDDAEGVLDDTLEADLDAIAGAMEEKVEAVVVVMRELDAEAAALKAEEQRLAARRKAREANAERLRAYTARCMGLAGTRKIATGLAVVSLRASTSVVVDCAPEALPAEYQRTKTTVDADKVALKKALEDGAAIQGVSLVTSDSLQVR